jgi:hypothetical protein
MRFVIEARKVCPDCEKVVCEAGHGTTVEQCEQDLGRSCEFPNEHHPERRRRLRVSVRLER